MIKYLIFEVESNCNLDCAYCYNIWKNPSFTGQKFTSSYKKALRTLKMLNKKTDFQHITFTGGEPLLAERLKELVLYCRIKRKNVSLITNGTAGNKSDYEELIGVGVNLFELPLHSDRPGPHDEMTGVKGSWEKSLQSIQEIIHLKGKICVDIVLTKINAEYLKETLSLLSDIGINRIALLRYNIGGKSTFDPGRLLLSHDELRSAYKTANDIAGIKDIILSSNVCTPKCILDPKDYKRIGFSFCNSDPEKRIFVVDVEGNIRFCNHSMRIMGNIYNDNLAGIFKSEYYQEWNSVCEYCRDCKDYRICFGGCKAASEQSGLGVNHVDPYVLINKLDR